MNARTLKDLRKTWTTWYDATRGKGLHRFAPIDPAVVLDLLDMVDDTKLALDNANHYATSKKDGLLEWRQRAIGAEKEIEGLRESIEILRFTMARGCQCRDD